MPKRRVSNVSTVKDDEILHVARITAVQSAAAAFAETEHDTQLSVERGYIWMITMVEFGFNIFSTSPYDAVAAGTTERHIFQVTKESQSAGVGMNDASLVCNAMQLINRDAAIGTDAGPLYYQFRFPYIRDFSSNPIPYAAQNIYFGFDSTNAAALTVNCRIFYYLRHVSDKYFFRVAQSLLS